MNGDVMTEQTNPAPAAHDIGVHEQTKAIYCKRCGQEKWLIDKYKMGCFKASEGIPLNFDTAQRDTDAA